MTRPILERLRIAQKGKTYVSEPDMNFYVLMEDAIEEIELYYGLEDTLRTEIKELQEDLKDAQNCQFDAEMSCIDLGRELAAALRAQDA